MSADKDELREMQLANGRTFDCGRIAVGHTLYHFYRSYLSNVV